MRSDQYMGLSSKAKAFVVGMKAEQYDEFEGAFYNTFPLYKYTSETPEEIIVYHEIVQAEPWSSGPMFFMTLKERRDLDWAIREVNEYLMRPYSSTG